MSVYCVYQYSKVSAKAKRQGVPHNVINEKESVKLFCSNIILQLFKYINVLDMISKFGLQV